MKKIEMMLYKGVGISLYKNNMRSMFSIKTKRISSGFIMGTKEDARNLIDGIRK